MKNNTFGKIANTVKVKIRETIENNLEEEKADLLKGLLLGETKQIEEEVKENFQIANVSHILAISGMHIGYIMIGIQILFKRMMGKKKTKIITIMVLIFYSFVTGFSPSIVRAVIMGSIALGAELIYRKSDIANNLAISLLGILLYNPFLILSVGLQLSYLGTIGIILFYPIILNKLKKKEEKEKTIQQKIKEIVAISLSSQMVILPITLYHFNTLGIYFIFTNLLVSIIIGPVLILGFFSLFSKIVFIPLKVGLDFLILISHFSQLPLARIYLPTISFGRIVVYFLALGVFIQIYHIFQVKPLSATAKRIKNLKALFYYEWKKGKKRYRKYIFILASVSIMMLFWSHKPLKIYFVDIGQGDSTFMITPQNKTILIDGGGSLENTFDVGKKTLLPYLLDRGYNKIDIIMISHFDQDHVDGLLSIMKEIKVKCVIIGKQFESCDNYEKFIKIVKDKNIKVDVVEASKRVKIEKNLYFDILWPSSDNVISENSINNNSLVCKMIYKNFSCIFTGDIEEIAEKEILEKYKETNVLQSTILKVAHHGSKSSSTEEFLKAIKPKIALIGVGKNNTFGHPNTDVISRLESLRS